MKELGLMGLVVTLVLPCLAAGPQERLHFPGNGYSIAPLEGKSDDQPYQALMMFLSATDAFAPNVNVQIQPHKGSLKEFAELSRKGFAAAGLKVVSEKVTATETVWEYAGTVQGRALHWYARAVPKKDRIYIVTATATESQWTASSEKLKSCVDSFRLDDSGPKS